MNVIPLLIVALYIVLLYGVSWYSTKLNKGGILGYLLAGRGLPPVLVATMIAGLAIGGASTVGVAENAYTKGISAGWYNGAWGVAAMLVGLLGAAKFRSLEANTIPELFERYFSTSGRVIGVIGQIVVQLTITALQYIAGAAVLTALMPNVFTLASGMMVTAVVFVGITLIGGYWAAGLSNFINVIVIYVGIILGAISSVSNAGGMAALTAKLPTQGHWFDPLAGMGTTVIIGWFAVMCTMAFSTQAVVQISFAAKDAKAAKWGFLAGGLLILPAGFLSAIFGIVAASQFVGIAPTMALPKVVMSLSPWIAGITLAGLWAADVSTAVGLLLGSSTLVVEDIWKRFVQPEMSEKQQMVVSRLVILALSLLTYVLAANVSGIIKTIAVGLSLTTAYTIVLFALLYTPSLCKKGSAFWTVLVGLVVFVAWIFMPASYRPVSQLIYLEWIACLITFFLVYLIDRRPVQISKNS
jgi:solute:Na+ symporter, SSS family